MSPTRIAAERPVLLALACALSQFLLTMGILLLGRAFAPPQAFGAVRLVAFASTVVFPLLLVHAFGLWKSVGFDADKVRPAPVFIAGLLLAAMYLSMGIHVRQQGALGSDLLIQFVNAFGEELLFRGVIFVLLLRLPVWQGIVLNGVLFGAMHLLHGFMDGNWSAAATQAAFTSLGGMMFTAIRYRTGSLWLAVALHMIKNLAVMYSNIEYAAGPQAEAAAQTVTVIIELLIVGWVVARMPRRVPQPRMVLNA